MNSAEFKSAAQGMNKSDSFTVWLLEPCNDYNSYNSYAAPRLGDTKSRSMKSKSPT